MFPLPSNGDLFNNCFSVSVSVEIDRFTVERESALRTPRVNNCPKLEETKLPVQHIFRAGEV